MSKKPSFTMRTKDGSAAIYLFEGGRMAVVADEFVVASDQKTLDAIRKLNED